MRRPLLALLFLVAPLAARAQVLPPDPGYLWDPNDTLYDDSKRRIAAAAEAATRASGHRLLVVSSRPEWIETDAFVTLASKTWPDRTILFVLRRDWAVRLVPSEAARPLLPDEAVNRFAVRVNRRLSEARFDKVIENVVHDVGETLAGLPPKPWRDWQHPLYLLGGGQDEEPVPAGVGIALAAVLALALTWFLRALWRDPKRVIAAIAIDGAGMVIGGLLGGGGGGGGGGGSSFSGGGGDSGGGGATDSW